jgi:protein O-mannosyl-transferase
MASPSPRLIGALLFFSTLLVFLPTLRNGFVNYDDPSYVLQNQFVNHGFTQAGFVQAFTGTEGCLNWHPLTWCSHMLDCQLFGLVPAGHHATNTLVHALNACLLFWAIWRLGRRVWPAAVVAALFAWHPLHVESVAWVAERKDVLSMFFWLLTILAYVRYTERPGVARYGLLTVCFAAGLMSKPMVVTLPCVLLLLDFWPLGRLQKTTRGRLLLEKLPLFVMTAASSYVTFWAQRTGGAMAELQWQSVSHRAANAVVAYATYLRKFLWPDDLAVFYPSAESWPASLVVGSALVLAAVTLLAWMQRRRRPYLLVGWLWYVGTLVPVIGLVQVGSQAMADRYAYIPLTGILVMVVWGAADLLVRRPNLQKPAAWACAATLAICVLLTERQLGFWKDSETLGRQAIAVTKDNYVAYHTLGFALSDAGRHEEALEMFQQAIRLKPAYTEAHINLGYTLVQLGRLDDAIAKFREVVQNRPNLFDGHQNLGATLETKGLLEEAEREFGEALRLRPDSAQTRRAVERVRQKRSEAK